MKRKENGRESTIVQNRESTGQVWETLGECTRKHIWKLTISILDNPGGN